MQEYRIAEKEKGEGRKEKRELGRVPPGNQKGENATHSRVGRKDIAIGA